MRSVDRLEKNRRMEEQKRRQRPPELPDEMEEEMEFPPYQSLDRQKNVFDRDMEKRWGGINTELSVFDKKAVFRTGK